MVLSKVNSLFYCFIRYYRHYIRVGRLLDRFENLSAEQIEAFHFQELKKLIAHAYAHVPYYSRLFDQVGFHPDQFNTLEDLKKIPFLTKQIIRENLEDLRATSIPQKYVKHVQTGGTTGMPTEFLLDKRYSTLNEMLFLQHLWKRIGFQKRDRCVVLREDKVARITEGRTYWKRNPLTNWLIMSAFHLNSDTFELFYRKIRSFHPKYILAFPSNALLLARYIEDAGLESFPGLKGVICASENLYDWQREYLSAIFKARIFSYYGHSEKCALASECTGSEGFEFYPQYGYVELINYKGEVCSREGERGEIVATGLHSYIAPFIRYRTDDVGIFTEKRSPDHPHWFTIRKIDGRIQDYLVDRDRVPKTYMHIDRPFWNLRDKVFAYQYVQDEPGKVVLRIQPKEELPDSLLDGIKEIFYKTYFKFELSIEIVKHIPRTRGGKFRYLVQNVRLDDVLSSRRQRVHIPKESRMGKLQSS